MPLQDGEAALGAGNFPPMFGIMWVRQNTHFEWNTDIIFKCNILPEKKL